jgi:hypothetical protein
MSEAQAVIAGVIIGGVLSVAGTFVGSYWGPLKLEKRREEKYDGPRKELLLLLLNEKPETQPIRSLERLQLVTGTTEEECRRLLIEVRARGVKMKGGGEGWALIDNYDFEQPFKEVDAVDV